MSRKASRRPQKLTLREVGREFGLADSTLRDWIEFGVFGLKKEIPTELRKGRKTLVLTPELVERLNRFLRYRRWILPQLIADDDNNQIELIVELLQEIDRHNYQGVIDVLTEFEQALDDALEGIRPEIQSLHATLHGEQAIDPEETD